MKFKPKTVKANAKCASFDIEVQAVIKPNSHLTSEEVTEISKKLRQKLSDGIANLPYAHIYPHEVRVR